MLKKSVMILLQSIALTAAAVVLAVGTNAVRSDGIPLVAEIPYEIFAACKDADVQSLAADTGELSARDASVLLVDARPAHQFQSEHAEGAVNIPYSALFGASDADVAAIRNTAKERKASAVIVYGAYEDPDQPGVTVDFAKPLADQLTEAGIPNVRHIEGGLAALKKQGTPTVKGK